MPEKIYIPHVICYNNIQASAAIKLQEIHSSGIQLRGAINIDGFTTECYDN